MAMTTMNAEKIVSETLGWFKARVSQHYVELSSEHMAMIEDELSQVLSHYVSDAAVHNRQYNPKSDKVEEI